MGRSYSANVGGSAPDYPRWENASGALVERAFLRREGGTLIARLVDAA